MLEWPPIAVAHEGKVYSSPTATRVSEMKISLRYI